MSGEPDDKKKKKNRKARKPRGARKPGGENDTKEGGGGGGAKIPKVPAAAVAKAAEAAAAAPAPTTADTKTPTPNTPSPEQAKALEKQAEAGVDAAVANAAAAAAANPAAVQKAAEATKAEVVADVAKKIGKLNAQPGRVYKKAKASDANKRLEELRVAKEAMAPAIKKGQPIGANSVKDKLAVRTVLHEGDEKKHRSVYDMAREAGMPALTGWRITALLDNKALVAYFANLDASDMSVFIAAASSLDEVVDMMNQKKGDDDEYERVIDTVALRQKTMAEAMKEFALDPKLAAFQKLWPIYASKMFPMGPAMTGGYVPDFSRQNRIKLQTFEVTVFDTDRAKAVTLQPYSMFMFNIGEKAQQLLQPDTENVDVIVRGVLVELHCQSIMKRVGEIRVAAFGSRKRTLRGTWDLDLTGRSYERDLQRYLTAIKMERYADLEHASFSKHRGNNNKNDLTAEQRADLSAFVKMIEEAMRSVQTATGTSSATELKRNLAKSEIKMAKNKILDILAEAEKAAKARRNKIKAEQKSMFQAAKKAGAEVSTNSEENVLLLGPTAMVMTGATAIKMAETGAAKSFAKHQKKTGGEVADAKEKPEPPKGTPAPSVFDQALFKFLTPIETCGRPVSAYDWEESGNVFFAGMSEQEKVRVQRLSEVYSGVDLERAVVQHFAVFELMTANDSMAVKLDKYKAFTAIVAPDGQQFFYNPSHGATPEGYEKLMSDVQKILQMDPDAAVDTAAATAATSGGSGGDIKSAPSTSADVKVAELAMAGLAPPQEAKIPDPLTHLAAILCNRLLRQEYTALREMNGAAGLNDESVQDPLTGKKAANWEAFHGQRVGHAPDGRIMMVLDRHLLYTTVKAYASWLTQYDCIFPLKKLRLGLSTDQWTRLSPTSDDDRGKIKVRVTLEFHRCSAGTDRRRKVEAAKEMLAKRQNEMLAPAAAAASS